MIYRKPLAGFLTGTKEKNPTAARTLSDLKPAGAHPALKSDNHESRVLASILTTLVARYNLELVICGCDSGS